MNLNNWMASLKQSTPLFNVSIPGTHESCALYDHATAGYTQCQWLSIPDQLANGIRFLDIRPAYEIDGNQFEINHGGYDQNITFAKVQEQIIDFLQDNPSEVVLMNVQQEYYYVKNADFVARFNQIVAGYEHYWFFEERIPTIEEARGRIVLIRGYNPLSYYPNNPKNGGWLTDKGIPLNALTIEGNSENEYFRTQNDSKAWESDKISAIEKMIDAGIIDNRFALNYLSYAHGGATPGRNAEAMNPVIYQYIAKRPDSILGILPMDFATNTPGFIEEIIRHNLQWGEVVAANFSGPGRKEIAVFIDKGNNTTGLSLFSPTGDGTFQLREVWDSGAGNWQATRTSRVVVGDFSGTGKDEIAVFYDYGNNQTGLWLFSATGDASFQPQKVWDSGFGNWQAGRMSKVVVGDFSGTGKDEIAAFYDYGNNRTGLWLFSATDAQPFQPQRVWDSGFGNWQATRTSRVVVGDFSGTGKADIAAFYDYGNNQTGLWLFSATDAQPFQPQRVWDSGVGKWEAGRMFKVVVGDFSETGKAEIAIFYDYHKGQTGLWLFSGTGTQPFQPQQVWKNAGGTDWGARWYGSVVVGDFSGSGKAEIAVFYSYGNNQTGLWLFSASDAQPFQPRQVWNSGVGNWRTIAVSESMVGDFSGSGKMEIATFYDYDLNTTGVWLFSAVSSNSFQPRMVWKGDLTP